LALQLFRENLQLAEERRCQHPVGHHQLLDLIVRDLAPALLNLGDVRLRNAGMTGQGRWASSPRLDFLQQIRCEDLTQCHSIHGERVAES
jgi:hypothetical protein